MVRKRNSSGQVLKSAARDGDNEGPAMSGAGLAWAEPAWAGLAWAGLAWAGLAGGPGTVCAVMPERLGQGYDETAWRPGGGGSVASSAWSRACRGPDAPAGADGRWVTCWASRST